MGCNKSFVLLHQKRMIEIVLNVLKQGFNKADILIVTNSPEEYAYLGTQMVEDQVKGQGPLGGLQAALNYVKTPYIFLVGCDMPFIRWDVIEYMVSRLTDSDDVLVPCVEGRLEPLHALYSRRCLSEIEKCLQNSRRRLNCFFSEVKVNYITENDLKKFSGGLKIFSNINNRQELMEAEKAL